jgi:ketosteroid isomerase-like protein
MKLSRTLFSLILSLTFITHLTYSQEVSSIGLPAELREVLDNYEQGWSNKNASALANLFTEDGFILRPGHPPVKGRENIEKAYEGSGGPLSLHAFDYEMSGKLAIIIGGYTDVHGNPDFGKFTLTLKKVGDNWLIHSDMDNGNKRY